MIERAVQEMIDAAIADERAACRRIAEEWSEQYDDPLQVAVALSIALDIAARSRVQLEPVVADPSLWLP